jgi:flagellar motor switch protein FliG
MLTYTAEERLALLLSVLGDEISEGAFRAMEPNQAKSLRQLLTEYKLDPPSANELEFIVGDFLKFFDFAVEALGVESNGSRNRSQNGQVEADDTVNVQVFPELQIGPDPISNLNRLHPYQILRAVGSDHPKTIALVLRSINVKQAAQVLELLQADTRLQVMNYLTVASTVPAPIVRQVLQTTVDKACAVKSRPIEVEQAKLIADLMRSVSKALRVEMMKQMAESNPELAEQIKSRLYLFEDILRLSDRDCQKLLSQLDTQALIVGLQRCPAELADKLLNNLSKRARETIVEEMEYKTNASDQEVEEGRKLVVKVIAELDESGEIKL